MSHTRDNSKDPTPYAVLCNCKGGVLRPVFLTEEQYLEQLSRPDDRWICPECKRFAEWDDECQETNPPEPV